MPGQPPSDFRLFLSRAGLFVLVGLVLYAGVYAASEGLIHKYGRQNRFFMVKTAPRVDFDYVILGASHSAVFDYRDLNARLEEMTGSTILNLSIVGAGIRVNRLLLDYFLVAHRTRSLVYVLDSFSFYSREWNEERLADARLFHRAPFDPALARLLVGAAKPSIALDYITGFSKINNPDRFAPDVRPEEGARFERTYRPIAQLDQQRIEYLYPDASGAAAIASRDRYLAELGDLIRLANARGVRVLVVRPPIPARILRIIPGEAEFDAALGDLLERNGVMLHDFSRVANDDKFFYDTDHLNLAGALNFFENHLKPLLADPS
jgi:hypothetical protein